MEDFLRLFRFYRRWTEDEWILTEMRGWIPFNELSFYLAYGFDPHPLLFDVRLEDGSWHTGPIIKKEFRGNVSNAEPDTKE